MKKFGLNVAVVALLLGVLVPARHRRPKRVRSPSYSRKAGSSSGSAVARAC
jgi:hypothetical protein